MDRLLPARPPLGIRPTTQLCALTGNPLVSRGESQLVKAGMAGRMGWGTVHSGQGGPGFTYDINRSEHYSGVKKSLNIGNNTAQTCVLFGWSLLVTVWSLDPGEQAEDIQTSREWV